MSHPFKKQPITSKPDTIKETLDLFCTEWKQGNIFSAKKYMLWILEDVPVPALVEILLDDIDVALGFFDLFIKSGLSDESEGTPAILRKKTKPGSSNLPAIQKGGGCMISQFIRINFLGGPGTAPGAALKSKERKPKKRRLTCQH